MQTFLHTYKHACACGRTHLCSVRLSSGPFTFAPKHTFACMHANIYVHACCGGAVALAGVTEASRSHICKATLLGCKPQVYELTQEEVEPRSCKGGTKPATLFCQRWGPRRMKCATTHRL